MKTEFEFIQNIKEKYGLTKVGDDCAVLPKDDETDMVITADLLVEDIDFRLEWTTPEFLGHKALAVSLSDIAAMGAVPQWAMLSIGIPEELWASDFLEQFYESANRTTIKFRVFGMDGIVGGDISRSPDKLVIDSIVGGVVPKGQAIMRSGAKVGDAIFVTGELGGAAAGLRLLSEGHRYPEENGPRYDSLLLRQLTPYASIPSGIFLREERIASAMIDLSDGLSSDLNHICQASGVGAKVNSESLPIHGKLKRIFRDPEEQLDMALNGGEDFELLFTVPKEKKPLVENLPVTQIGEITSNTGIIELVRDGKTEILEPKGYRHF